MDPIRKRRRSAAVRDGFIGDNLTHLETYGKELRYGALNHMGQTKIGERVECAKK